MPVWVGAFSLWEMSVKPTEEQREAIEWAAGQAYSYAKPMTGESLMMKRWRVLSDLFAATSVEMSHYVSDGGACSNCGNALIDHKGGRECPAPAATGDKP
jgi:hypothetical protein